MASNVSPVDSNSRNLVFQFKISLKYLKPPIWRRVLVPCDYTFKDLHYVIQNVMSWGNTHMHKFDLKDHLTNEEIEVGGSGDLGFTKWWPESTLLSTYFKSPNDKGTYDYDFGSTWSHIILLEKILPADRTKKYPQCIAGKRASPPEHDIDEDSDEFDSECFDAKLITFRKCRDFLQDDEKEVQDKDSSSKYESDESYDYNFSYQPRMGKKSGSTSSEDESDSEQFYTGPELATGKTELLQQTIDKRQKIVDYFSQKSNETLKLPQKRQVSEDDKSKSVPSKVIVLENKDLQKNSTSVSEIARVIEISESDSSNNKDLAENTNVPSVIEDAEDYYGKFIASQMRDIKDLEKREELRIEIQQLISKYRFKN